MDKTGSGIPGASLGVIILPLNRQSRGTPFMTFKVGPVVATKEERTSDARSTALIASLHEQEREGMAEQA